MVPRSNQHLSPNATGSIPPTTKHGFIHTLHKSLSSISLSSRRSADAVSSNTRGPRRKPQSSTNIYGDSFDISQVPKDEFASALRGTLLTPGQHSTSPYFNSGPEQVRYNHSMFDLSGHLARAAEATNPPDQPSPCTPHQPNVVNVVSPSHKAVMTQSGHTLHHREARIPLSTSAANMRTAPHHDFDKPSKAYSHRTSTSYDWLFNSTLEQQPNDFGTETFDLIGPDPFRWIPMRAHVAELQRDLQVPESTASGALALTESTSHDQTPLTYRAKHTKSHDKGCEEVVWWSGPQPAFTEDRIPGGKGDGKVQSRQMDSDQYPKTRL